MEVEEEYLKHQEKFEKYFPVVSAAHINEYGWPEMDTLRYEASLCIAFGLFQSAITLCNHMMESLLKYSLIYHHSIKNEKPVKPGTDFVKIMEDYTEEGIKKYGHVSLSQSIKAASSLGLIESEEEIALNEFRVNFRNAYSHADKKKIFGDNSVSVQSAIIEVDGISTGEEVEVVISKNPIVHSVAQAIKAREDAPGYFLYLDGLARRMKLRVFPNG